MTTTIVRIRPQLTENRYGGDEKDWSAPDRLTITDVLAAPGDDPERRTDGRETVIADWTVYLPDGSDVRSGDRCELFGKTYDVDGEVQDWGYGFGSWAPGLVARLRRVEG